MLETWRRCIMGMPIYRCTEELPERLPGYLAGRAEFAGARVERRPVPEGDEKYVFSIVVCRDKVEVTLHGERDAEGMSVCVMGGAFFRRVKTARLYRDLKAALVVMG